MDCSIRVLKKLFILLLLLIVFSMACHHIFDSADDPSYIRVKNSSVYNYSSVKISFTTAGEHFGDILSGSLSGYKKFPVAYRYGYVQLYIDGHEYVLQPIDYVGEEPLGSGYFTYTVAVADLEDTYSITIEVERDH